MTPSHEPLLAAHDPLIARLAVLASDGPAGLAEPPPAAGPDSPMSAPLEVPA
jgi:hypothetical protein